MYNKYANRFGDSPILSLSNIFSLLVGVTSLSLLIWSITFISKPGPTTYYSHFSGLYLSACLSFQCIQLSLLASRRTHAFRSHWYLGFSYTYWAVITLSGFICAVCYAITMKSDSSAIEFLAFFVGLAGMTCLSIRHDALSKELSELTLATEGGNTVQARFIRSSKYGKRASMCCMGFWKSFNRFLKFIHWCFSILFIAGAVGLALQFGFVNPGTIVEVTLLSGETESVNYNCTSVAFNGTTLPTFWLEADPAHGIVDFLSLQTSLALTHGRNSCSYDPPNFGWSARLPSNLENIDGYLNPLLQALGKQDEEKVLVGWGDGAQNALLHTIENANTTKGLVILDASPRGIEWYDAQRANNWTEQQMLDYRSVDLKGRVFLAEMILVLGIPWGLMPIFIPNNSTGHVPVSQYARLRAQAMKEDMWALQYYSLVQETSGPIDTYLLDTVVPPHMPTYAVLTHDAGSVTPSHDNGDDVSASNNFTRGRKVDMANHIAGGALARPVIWCAEADCALNFPVVKAEWTAGVLAGLGV